ncbi:MAG TPA: hypothetical protein VMA74_04165 [Dyella sp.]|uniref:hypothetical protein n=1 Tax=Dyella sp. TaxID=1869338 RepID=UPI002C7600FE|nr:hypothetical protein [Dyella sp.]HUB88906.1 hypothetical protein [Dyella sp.]
MLTKEQANAASDALLHPGQLEREAVAAKIAERCRLWLRSGILRRGALLGFSLGAVVGIWLPGHSFTPEIVGFVIGGGVSLLLYHFRA